MGVVFSNGEDFANVRIYSGSAPDYTVSEVLHQFIIIIIAGKDRLGIFHLRSIKRHTPCISKHFKVQVEPFAMKAIFTEVTKSGLLWLIKMGKWINVLWSGHFIKYSVLC